MSSLQESSKTEGGRETGPFNESEIKRYSRQLLLPEIGPKGQEKLKKAKVLVVGAGGLGSPASLYLAGAGVGKIGIADPDQVELSNLNRQILHWSVGTPKADSARRTLSQLNPEIEIIAYQEKITNENIEKILPHWELVLDATDSFESKFLLNDACVRANLPWIHAGVVGWKGQILTVLPHRSPCLRCIIENTPSLQEGMTCLDVGILGSVAGILGSLQATEAIKVILGQEGKSLAGRLLTINALTMTFREIKVVPNPACSVCQLSNHPLPKNMNRVR